MAIRSVLRYVCCAVMSILVLWTTVAHAHRANVFAYAEGGNIIVEAGYGKDRPVIGGSVVVSDKADGKEFLRGVTDKSGRFIFSVPGAAKADRADLRVTLMAGEGHLDSWVVGASEYASGVDTAGTLQDATESKAFEGRLQRIVEEAVERKIAPMRDMLVQELQGGPGMIEIVGGLGYFVGLLGVAAYLKSRKSGSRGA